MSEGKRIRAVFFGTPEYAATTLRAVLASSDFEVPLVVTQPDRPAGRGHQLRASAVKEVALAASIPVYQPESLRTEEARAPIAAIDADVFVVAAYGLIFGPKTLALPRAGCLNLHASLLPANRGASPISAAILNGDPITGVTLMVMERGLDTGPMISTREIAIGPDDTTESLTPKLAELAGTLAAVDIPRYLAGEFVANPQPAHGATVCRPVLKADGWIDWQADAASIERLVRAMWNWPRAWTTLGDEAIQVHSARLVDRPHGVGVGEVSGEGSRLIVGCGEGALELVTVQQPGGKPVPGGSLMTSRKVQPGMRLGGGQRPFVPTPMVAPADS